MAFIYTNEKYTEKEIMELSLLILPTHKHTHTHKNTYPYIGLNLDKETKDHYSENFKTLKKEIKKIHQKIKIVPMLMGWKYQSHKNGHHI